jgi:ribonuclease BN (tRNA processing enzyme)
MFADIAPWFGESKDDEGLICFYLTTKRHDKSASVFKDPDVRDCVERQLLPRIQTDKWRNKIHEWMSDAKTEAELECELDMLRPFRSFDAARVYSGHVSFPIDCTGDCIYEDVRTAIEHLSLAKFSARPLFALSATIGANKGEGGGNELQLEFYVAP